MRHKINFIILLMLFIPLSELSGKQRLDSLVLHIIDSNTNQWINLGAYNKFAYDVNGNTSLYIEHSYSGSELIQENLNQDKCEFIYDTNGNITREISFEWDTTTSQWIPDYRYEYFYDSNNNNIVDGIFKMDDITGQWVNWRAYQYIYDSNGNMAQDTTCFWNDNTNEWDVSCSYTNYIYNSDGKMIQKLSFDQNETSDLWIPQKKYEYNYDASGNMNQSTYYRWNSNTNLWIPYSKHEYIYDVNGNMSQDTYYIRNGNTLISQSKYEYNYDANENMVRLIDYSWDTATSQWLPNEKLEVNYDLSNSLSDIIMPPAVIVEEMTNQPISYFSYEWNEVDNNWVNIINVYCSYSEQKDFMSDIDGDGQGKRINNVAK